MSSTVLSMSMSLDGFIAGPNETLANGLGDGGQRLHDWFFPGAEGDADFDAAIARLQGANRRVYDELMSTGAVIAGRRLFEHLGVEHRELERVGVVEGEAGVTHLHYRLR